MNRPMGKMGMWNFMQKITTTQIATDNLQFSLKLMQMSYHTPKLGFNITRDPLVQSDPV